MVKKVEEVSKKKLLFAASEALPFIATGGLGDVIGSLPKALAKTKDLDVRVILPLYADIPAKYREAMEEKAAFVVALAWRNQPCKIFSTELEGVTFYFIENEYYFNRPGLYGYYDDGERFAFFSRAVPEALKALDFIPDIVHANDWQTAMVPVFLRTLHIDDPVFKNTKTVFTIHNIEYQGRYDPITLGDLMGLGVENLPLLEYKGALNLVKAAIVVSDMVTTVSPSYSEELKYAYFAHGLEDIIMANEGKMRGVLNGIDESFYNPRTDEALFANFSYTNLDKKAENKAGLQRIVGLQESPDTPLVAIVSRMVESKGLDLLVYIMDEILKEKVQIVVLGCGDKKYEDFFRWKANRYPAKMVSLITYDRDLSHKIYGGADLLLMPSKMEPCGLSQMIASRYGTVPVVRKIGGLADSIKDYGEKDGNGFTFNNYNAHEMLGALNRGLALYGEPEKWTPLVQKVMRKDFSWSRPAKKYIKLYEELV